MARVANPARFVHILRGRPGRMLPGRARALLGVNAAPHPGWLNILPNVATLLSRGGVAWVLGALGATALKVPRSRQALRVLLPSLLGTTLMVEHLLKRLFRRRRPLSARLRALAQRKRPSPSFPSGDAAAAYAGAWALGAIWPGLGPAFLAGAAALGFTRIRVGLHRPEDIVGGAVVGILLAELIGRVTGRLANRHSGDAGPRRPSR